VLLRQLLFIKLNCFATPTQVGINELRGNSRFVGASNELRGNSRFIWTYMGLLTFFFKTGLCSFIWGFP